MMLSRTSAVRQVQVLLCQLLSLCTANCETESILGDGKVVTAADF